LRHGAYRPFASSGAGSLGWRRNPESARRLAPTAKAARETGLGAAGYYSSATHGAGATISITQATHGLRSSRGLVVQAQVESTGAVVLPDISVNASGDVTVTFGASQSANTIRVTIIG